MGYMLGIYPNDTIRQSLLEGGSAGTRVDEAQVFPQSAQLSDAQWESIKQYFLEQAPEKLNIEENALFPPADTNLSIFKPRQPSFQLSPPSTTFIRIDPGNGLLMGDAFTQSLYKFNRTLDLQQIALVGEGAVALNTDPNFTLITLMGSFSPTDEASGSIAFFPKVAGQQSFTILDDLQRPVHSSMTDINSDGRKDLVISEFAKWTGGLSWWENLGDNFLEHPLKLIPGATRTIIRDVNNDGLPDIYALFGQGNEGIYLFINKGDETFEEKEILSFPSSYGSSFFDLLDVNNDGLEDILYTAGDNADYPPMLKPYHGIRIFQQIREGFFEESFFYPLPGAYGAQMKDFDLDGDLDIAAISFFPDFEEHDGRGFIYLENMGGMNFNTHLFPETTNGRWLVMDSGDIDGDKDIDIVLGSLTFEVPGDTTRVQSWIDQGIPFLLLENQTN